MASFLAVLVCAIRGVPIGKTLLTGNQTSRGPAYGAHLAECFGLPAVPTHVHHTLQRGMLAVSELKSRVPPADPNPSRGYNEAYQVIMQFKIIRRELWLNGPFTSSDALRAGETYGRAFKSSTGVAPHQWQLGRRMKRAQTLLTGSSLSIAEVALECGFSSQSHFATAFKENIGASLGVGVS
ncbi:AraC family transcriptional regulator [Mesorhizobium sp. M0408]|uniref:helix-turn-helix transcriptional regulator n=1 Tax=Mesorhizobium sp. M0408 TaxID=2956942 RepID=UPI00333CB776